MPGNSLKFSVKNSKTKVEKGHIINFNNISLRTVFYQYPAKPGIIPFQRDGFHSGYDVAQKQQNNSKQYLSFTHTHTEHK